MFVEFCICTFAILTPVVSFSHGAPDFSCKDPSTFHTKKLNATHEGIIMPEDMLLNPYTIVTETNTYRPGDKVKVTIQSSDTNSPLRGFFLQAVQAGIHLRDLRRRPFGRFENTSADERPSVCQSFWSTETTGITHSNNRSKQSVSVTWIAPVEYNPGEIQFLATGVLDYTTYWTNIRSERLFLEGYSKLSENTTSGKYTPTATWFRWLQYLRQLQLLKKNLGIPLKASKDNKGAGHAQMEAGHDHHHYLHDHAHDHSHFLMKGWKNVTQEVAPISTTQKPSV